MPTATKLTARARRQFAIGMLNELYLPTDTDPGTPYYLRCGDTEEIAGNIEKLAQLGRTTRWQDAITRWAAMVRAEHASPEHLRWAFLQGMIYANHASE